MLVKPVKGVEYLITKQVRLELDALSTESHPVHLLVVVLEAFHRGKPSVLLWRTLPTIKGDLLEDLALHPWVLKVDSIVHVKYCCVTLL
jgi:hypothetical protein